jgi:hypothetical protein
MSVTYQQLSQKLDELDRAANTLANEQSHMTPVHTNISGGRQSHIKRDYTLIPADALAVVASVMYEGAKKYKRDNWRLIAVDDHLNHAINHVYLHLAGNTQECHLSHAVTRLLMALELDLTSPSISDTVDTST